MSNFMEKIEMLSLLVLFPWLITGMLSYPVFGTKRYGRSTSTPSRRSSLEPYMQPTYYSEPPNKYPPFATASEFDVEYYYPPEPTYNYPLASPYPRLYPTDKYTAGYQTLMPYMYDTRRARLGYYGMPEPVLPVDEGEERTDALPIGQETWFEPQGALADANAAFLQNLILSQMYNDAQLNEELARRPADAGVQEGGENTDSDWSYDTAPANAGSYYPEEYEDEDVKDLKSLVKKTNGKVTGASYLPTTRRVIEGKTRYEKNLESNGWDSYGKRSNEYFGKVVANPSYRSQHNRWVNLPNELSETFERKARRDDEEESKRMPETEAADATGTTGAAGAAAAAGPKTSETPLPADTTTEAATPFDTQRGQKEVPLLRPPSRHTIFTDLGSDQPRRGDLAGASTPSVYETIKQLLTMEQGLKGEDVLPPAMKKKRFVSNEETLVDQLGLLKKSPT